MVFLEEDFGGEIFGKEIRVLNFDSDFLSFFDSSWLIEERNIKFILVLISDFTFEKKMFQLFL